MNTRCLCFQFAVSGSKRSLAWAPACKSSTTACSPQALPGALSCAAHQACSRLGSTRVRLSGLHQSYVVLTSRHFRSCCSISDRWEQSACFAWNAARWLPHDAFCLDFHLVFRIRPRTHRYWYVVGHWARSARSNATGSLSFALVRSYFDFQTFFECRCRFSFFSIWMHSFINARIRKRTLTISRQ